MVNSWDFPSYLILTLGLLSLAVYFVGGTLTARLTLFALLAVTVVGVSILAFLPFHQTYETFNSGLEASKWRTPVLRFLGIHGLFLFVIASFLLYQARDVLRGLTGSVRYRNYDPAVPGMRWMRVCIGVALLGAIFFGAAGFWNVTLLFVFLTLAGIVAWKVFASNDESRAYEAVPLFLLGLALFIGIGVDLVRVEGDIGRMNTLFKYYLEIWVLFSVVSAYMLWQLGTSGFLKTAFGVGSGIWAMALVALLGSSLIYTTFGSRARLSDRFSDSPPTLNGMAYMSEAVHQEQGQSIRLEWDLEAIDWVLDNVKGSPVILEAHLSQYRWGARFSTYTGLPTVIGWPWHQIQQRTAYSFAIDDRAEDVREMYETVDHKRALELLREYRVRYVIVGDLERITYPGNGLSKFEVLGRKVFENDRTGIYETTWD